MKNIFKYTVGLVLLLGLYTACQDEYENMDVYHSFVQTSFGTSEKKTQINKWFSVHDLSRGEVSRKWIFPPEAIGEDSTSIQESSEQNVRLMFRTPGTYTIKLENTFGQNVYVDGIGFINSKENEESFDVIILDSLRASFDAIRTADDTNLTIANEAQNEIEGGRVVQFISTATGEPKSWNWTITREDGYLKEVEGTLGVASFKFSTPGLYNVTFIASGDYGADTVSYTNLVKVIPSSDPVLLDDVLRSSEDEIGLVFSRSMQDASTIDKAAFSVSVENKGVNIPAQIIGVTTDENIIKLKLNIKLYNTDDITVGYDASIGNLVTEDAMLATSFSNQKLTNFSLPNIIADAGYDVGFEKYDVSAWPYLWWGGTWEKYTLSISETMSHSGQKSAYLDIQPEGGAIFGSHGDKNDNILFNTVGGQKYLLGLWVYVDTFGDIANPEVIPNIRFYWINGTDWNVGGPTFSPDDVGKWVYKTAIYEAPTTGENGFMIRGENAKNTQNFKVYLDDLSFTVYEERP